MHAFDAWNASSPWAAAATPNEWKKIDCYVVVTYVFMTFLTNARALRGVWKIIALDACTMTMTMTMTIDDDGDLGDQAVANNAATYNFGDFASAFHLTACTMLRSRY